MLMENLTWEEVRDLVETDPVVIIPLGATEQHGHHLPVKVDIAIANYIAQAVGEQSGALVTPPLNFGYSIAWPDYPGTLSFSSETFLSALHDICYSLIRVGFKKLFLLNGHNGNLMLMQTAACDLIDKYGDHDISIAVATYIHMAMEKCNAIGENFNDGTHANEAETSIMMYLFGDEVKEEKRILAGETYQKHKIINFDAGAYTVNQWPKQSYHGAYGNPGLATREKGRRYVEAFIEDITAFVADFRAGKYDPIGKDGMPQVFQ